MLKSRKMVWIIGAVGLAVILYLVPLFHVVSLKDAREQSAAKLFDAVAYVDTFWQGPLLESSRNAVDAADLLAAFQQDPASAAEQFGKRLGLSSNSSFFVSGQGQIVALENDSISIALQESAPAAVVIEIGPVFGNAIRDGSGLLDISDFSNTQDFNAISSEINRRVEEQVLPLLAAKASVGASVRFVGGVDVSDSEGVPSRFTLVPVMIEFP